LVGDEWAARMKRTLVVARQLRRQADAAVKRKERQERKAGKRRRRGAVALGAEVGVRVDGVVP
jgi:hypothetical protein